MQPNGLRRVQLSHLAYRTCWAHAGHPTACTLRRGSATYAPRLPSHLRNHARRAAAPSLLQLLQRGGG